ncbi:MAG: SpoIIE family protein phosphatase [Clostridiales bacterium]|nr:SpoIIE family protein phosphatase [Clostridiales bacterium]
MLKTQGTTNVKNSVSAKFATQIIVVVVLSILASTSRILGFLSPVNVIIASVSGNWSIFAFCASLVTYLVTGNLTLGLFELSSMFVIIGVKILVKNGDRENKIKDKGLSNAFLTTGAMVFCGVVTSVFFSVDSYQFIFRMMVSILCGCVVYFVQSTKNRASVDGVLDINGINGASLGIIYVLIITTLSSVGFFGINLGRILGAFVVLVAAGKYKHIGGAVCGALTTCGVILCSPELAKNTLLLATCGLICGAFVPMGQVVTTLIFIFSSVVSLMAVGFNSDTFNMLTDIAIGGVIYAAIPQDIGRKLFKILGGKQNAIDIVGQTASSRLKFTSGTLKDVRKQLLGISDELNRNNSFKPLGIRVKCEVCQDCQMNDVCWKNNKKKIMHVFKSLDEKAQNNGHLSLSDVNETFPLCTRSPRLANTYNTELSNMISEQTSNQKVKELRELLSEQLVAMEDLLTDLSYKVEKISGVDASLSSRVKSYLAKLGFAGVKACVYSDDSKMKRIEVFTPSQIKSDLVKITVEIGNIVGCDLELPVTSKVEGMCRMVFTESPEYSIKSGVAQFTANDDFYSGDTIERIWLSKSEYAIVLSDGMGTGKRAKLDSTLAVNLITRFVASGISGETSLKLLNSILRVKGWEESFATADIALVDLYFGSVKIVKAGAAPSYILRDEVLIRIEGQAFPLGILSETTPVNATYKLFANDKLIMISDGVSEDVLKKAVTEINRHKLNPNNSAELIANYAKNNGSDDGEKPNNDDITVCVLNIQMNK